MALCWNYYWRDGLLFIEPSTSASGILINHEDHCETSLPSVSAPQRNIFFEDRVTRKQASLQTRDKVAAQRIFSAKNESHLQPAINLQIARAYLMASYPLVARRTWQHVIDEIIRIKSGETKSAGRSWLNQNGLTHYATAW